MGRLPVGHVYSQANKHDRQDDRKRKRTSIFETRHLSYPDLLRWVQGKRWDVRDGTSQEISIEYLPGCTEAVDQPRGSSSIWRG